MAERTLIGRLITEIHFRLTKSSNLALATFSISTKERTVDCMAWKEIAEKIKTAVLGKDLTLTGYFKSADDGKEIFNVTAMPEAKKVSNQQYFINLYGSSYEYKSSCEQYDEEQMKQGFVKVDGRWIKEKYAMFYKGEWVEKIEWLMNILGAKLVTEELRSSGISFDGGGFNKKTYDEKIQELTDYALFSLSEKDNVEEEIKIRVGNNASGWDQVSLKEGSKEICGANAFTESKINQPSGTSAEISTDS